MSKPLARKAVGRECISSALAVNSLFRRRHPGCDYQTMYDVISSTQKQGCPVFCTMHQLLPCRQACPPADRFVERKSHDGKDVNEDQEVP